ncbi:MAG: hypothetical protein ACK52L_21825 [Pirellula sp.]|jgi:hypothetical protein
MNYPGESAKHEQKRMETTKQKTISLGFLTVRKHPSRGYFGGFLVLNLLARPLEFHCTLPVQPTRAQQILYGATLDEFISGEQIARALILKAKSSLEVVFTDTLAALSGRHVQETPLIAIDGSWERSENTIGHPVSQGHELKSISALDYRFSVLSQYESDLQRIHALFHKNDSSIDLIEPFGRIEEALLEAHPAAKAA